MFFRKLCELSVKNGNPSSFNFDRGSINPTGKVWRSDKRPPSTIKKSNGFQARNNEDSIRLHIAGCQSRYIPFGNSLLDATRFCRPISYDHYAHKINYGSYLYLVNVPEIHINVRDIYPVFLSDKEAFGASFAETENEIAGIAPIADADIQKARRYIAIPGLGVPYFFLGEPYINTAYQPRNWSISIPSANTEEAVSFENEFRKNNWLSDKRFVLLNEAQEISSALKNYSKSLKQPANTNRMFTLKHIPASVNQQQSTDYAIKHYKEFAQELGLISTCKFSMFTPAQRKIENKLDKNTAPSIKNN